jgi:intein/homing endonuclease
MSVNIKPKWDWKKELETNEYMNPIQKQIIERLHDPSYIHFNLDKSFVKHYAYMKPPFGFNGFGELVYMRTYSRLKDDGSNEQWHDTIERVVNGTYNLQKRWIQSRGLEWSDYKAQKSAQEMYDRMFHMKFLPPGRGLWAMGSELTEERGLNASLNNCAFTSTENIKEDLSKPFRFLMDMSMVGVGVGFDTLGAGKTFVRGPDRRRTLEKFVIPDTREGWVEATGRLIDSYLLGIQPLSLDYTALRPAGTLIGGFGGKSSGLVPLQQMHKSLEDVLEKQIGKPITSRTIVDISNMIGQCVVAGNVRRCLPKGSFVHAKKGLVKIENIKLGDQVLTKHGYRKVVNVFHQGIRKVIKIITQDGEFVCTPNHRMAVLSDINGSYIWKMASELKSTDRLITSRSSILGSKTKLPNWNYVYPAHSTTCKEIIIPKLDEDVAWLIGLFQADGYVHPNYKQEEGSSFIDIVFGLDELDMAKKAKHILERFGKSLKISLKKRKNENSYELRCTSKQLAWYFNKNIKQSKNPLIIPSFILNSTKNIKLAYIAGLMDGDGCAKNRPIRIITSVYLDFVKSLQCLLYSCGIESRLNIGKRTKSRLKNWRLIHQLNLITSYSREQIRNIPQSFKSKQMKPNYRSNNANTIPFTFCKDLNFRIKKKFGYLDLNIDMYSKIFKNELDFVPVKVIKIINMSDKIDTFDIQVEKNEQFFCNGYLTHNTAELALGDVDDEAFLDLKNYDMNPERASYGWTSNNSVSAKLGMNYDEIAERIRKNGEPGVIWMDNIKQFSRMGLLADNKDHRCAGVNPCVEQSLESMELCNLVENFPNTHKDLEDFKRTLKFAYMYAKTVTLGETHWPETNRVLLRNRRIGCSVSGVAQFVSSRGLGTLKEWLERGYDEIEKWDNIYSEWMTVPKSIKKTSVKPSGSVSSVAGATSGMHWPISEYYIRRMRLAKGSELIEPIRRSGYHLEDSVDDPSSLVVEFPVHVGKGIRSEEEISMWEQFQMAAFLQRYWSDNQVSCTIKFDPLREGNHISQALDYFQYQLKGISMLPKRDGVYKQPPYDPISAEKYADLIRKIKPLDFSKVKHEKAEGERFCSNDTCEISKK